MQKLALFLLKAFGWKLCIAPPPSKKYVLIGAPHTSNWDFVVGLLGLWGGRIRARFLGKKELFKPPLGFLMRALGSIPVDRSRRSNLVDRVAEIFKREEEIAILITPEGTRGRAPYTTPCWLAPAWGPRQKVPGEVTRHGGPEETGNKGITGARASTTWP
jgi:1-acyl-sn-glycerol-3-phosphate acyltransferase